jgi:oligoribonuclease (3'-5' exoribonuclease)
MRRLIRIMEEARAVPAKVKDALVWVDLEMTGLDVRRDHIMEMACLITDAQLNLVAEVQFTHHQALNSHHQALTHSLISREL